MLLKDSIREFIIFMGDDMFKKLQLNLFYHLVSPELLDENY
jgi:hypothetical protein